MKNCPYCSSVLNDNVVQCHVCGYVYQQYYQQPQQQSYQQYQQYPQSYQQYQQYQQNYTQGNYNGAQQQNTQQHYSQSGTQQNMYNQQYQQPQNYSYGPQNQATANNYQYDIYSSTSNTKSAKTKDKKQRPLWVKILIGIAVTIGVIWAISDGMKGAENADEWLNSSSQEAKMAEIEAEIIDILDSTKVESFLTPTIGQMVMLVFNDFDISIESDENSESIYYVTICGDYSPSPSYSYYSLNGSITYRVDIDMRTCTVWSDPSNIHSIFVAYIVS